MKFHLKLFFFLFFFTFCPFLALASGHQPVVKLSKLKLSNNDLISLDKHLYKLLGSSKKGGLDLFITKLNGKIYTNILKDHINNILADATAFLAKNFPDVEPYFDIQSLNNENIPTFIKNEIEDFGILKKIEDLNPFDPKDADLLNLWFKLKSFLKNSLDKSSISYLFKIDDGENAEINALFSVNLQTGQVFSITWSYLN